MQQQPTQAPGAFAFALVLVLASLVLAHQAWSISGFSSLSSAGVFPMLATGTMVVTGLIVLLDAARRRRAENGASFFADVVAPRILLFAAMIIGYMLLLQPLGFILASFLFLFAGMAFLWRGNLLRTLIVSIVAVAAIYVLFRYVFVVVLPRGVIF
ncbi:tripartite tricarboxylate transporter TctB family protein [Pararhizobium haloflavum]|uniref:tripartite tricarboxylate transporter TctB family protein n=1 Tax=Pararhizobium haloflavum TaxID=2037914 RepID=UPI000C18D2D2|nr:tripartite tricarboxylate transporter TctB family protein [Pararhizobium haloflavum]